MKHFQHDFKMICLINYLKASAHKKGGLIITTRLLDRTVLIFKVTLKSEFFTLFLEMCGN